MRSWTRLAMMGALSGALIITPAITPALPFTPAADAASYRYWSYWTGGDGGWSYSSWGPASLRPTDGSVEGWRFGVGPGTNSAGLMPRSAADFNQVCAGTEPKPGTKRVAIVIDPGLPEHAPDGESPRTPWAMCVTAEPSASGFDILRAAASVRTQQGMVCGLAGYPANECAVVVSTPRPPQEPVPSREPAPVSDPSAQPVPETQPSVQPKRPASEPVTDGGAVSDTGTDDRSTSVAQKPPRPTAESTPGSPTRTGDAVSRDGDSTSMGSASDVTARASLTPVAPGSRSDADHRAANPDPQVTIMSAAVTDNASGPGPTAALIGAVAIGLLAALTFLRRRSTRSDV